MLYQFESVANPLRSLELGDILIPGFGCLTVAESCAFDHFIHTEALAVLQEAQPHTEAIATGYLHTVLAALLLISRHRPDWTIAQVEREFSPEQRHAAADFMLGERWRWKDVTPQPETESTDSDSSEPFSWSRLRLRLAAGYPGEPTFTRDGFGNCPLSLIEEALEELNLRELQAANAAAIPIALLGTYLLNAEGCDKAEPNWINPYERILAQRSAKAEIEPAAAQLFLDLCKASKVPPWAVAIADVEKLRLAAG